MQVNFLSLIERLAVSRESSKCARVELENSPRPKKIPPAAAAPTMLVDQEMIWAQRAPIPEGIETPFQFFHLILS